MNNYDPLLLPENRSLLELECLLEACPSNEDRLKILVDKEIEFKISTSIDLYERYRLYVEFKRTQILLGANPLNEHWNSLSNHILIIGKAKPLISEKGLREVVKAQIPTYQQTNLTMVNLKDSLNTDNSTTNVITPTNEEKDKDKMEEDEDIDIYWKGNQVEFIELIYALIYAKKITGGNDKQIRNKFAKILNHKLKDEDQHLVNITNRKKERASFLTLLKETFENKIESKIEQREQKKEK